MTGPKGYVIESKRQVTKVCAASGLVVTLHDLQRTFITVAESIDVPPYAIKRLANHLRGNDVTAGYIVCDLEHLRAPMQEVADFLDRATGQAETTEPIPIVSAASRSR